MGNRASATNVVEKNEEIRRMFNAKIAVKMA